MAAFSKPAVNTPGAEQSDANFIGPGKRPRSSTAPAIFVDQNGAARLVAGASGGLRVITAAAQVDGHVMFSDWAVLTSNSRVWTSLGQASHIHSRVPEVFCVKTVAEKHQARDSLIANVPSRLRNAKFFQLSTAREFGRIWGVGGGEGGIVTLPQPPVISAPALRERETSGSWQPRVAQWGLTGQFSSFQVAMNYLWFNLTLAQSVDEPRLHHQLEPMLAQIFKENPLPQAIQDGLKRLGHSVKLESEFASIQATAMSSDGSLWGKSDTNDYGWAAGY